jgi:acetyl-CoA synthetase
VESALIEDPSVAEAAVVGRNDDVTGQAICAFVTLRGDNAGSPELAQTLRDHVADRLGKFTRPKYIMFTPELPKTRSGKIMRRLLRDIVEGRAVGDTTTLADAAIMSELKDRARAEQAREAE